MGADGMERWCPHVPVSTTTWEQAPATESDLSSFDEDEKPHQMLGRRGTRGTSSWSFPLRAGRAQGGDRAMWPHCTAEDYRGRNNLQQHWSWAGAKPPLALTMATGGLGQPPSSAPASTKFSSGPGAVCLCSGSSLTHLTDLQGAQPAPAPCSLVVPQHLASCPSPASRLQTLPKNFPSAFAGAQRDIHQVHQFIIQVLLFM